MKKLLYKTHEVPVYAQNKIGVSPAMNYNIKLKLLRFKKYSEEELKEMMEVELNKVHMKFAEKDFLPIILNANEVCAFVGIAAKQLWYNYKLGKKLNVDLIFSPQNIFSIFNATVGKQIEKAVPEKPKTDKPVN